MEKDTLKQIEENTRITKNCVVFFTIITSIGLAASIVYGIILSGII